MKQYMLCQQEHSDDKTAKWADFLVIFTVCAEHSCEPIAFELGLMVTDVSTTKRCSIW